MFNIKELVKYTSNFNVLYVEDNIEMQNKMKSLFKNFFASVTVASNGEEGLNLYKNAEFEIVLSDINMPILNGIEMSKQIKEINPYQAIILITAFEDTNYLLKSIKICVDGYVLKPFSIEQISEVILKVAKNIFLLQQDRDYQQKLEDEVQKKTQELAEQNARLKAIFSTTKDGIAILDLETNFLDFNDAYLEMTGFSRAQLLTKSCMDLSIKEDREDHKLIIQEAISKGYYKSFEKSCIVNNDKKITVSMSLALMPNKKELIASTKDVTQANKIKKKIECYLALIDENIVSSSTDLDGIITDISQAFCDISGYTKEELIGQNHRIIRDKHTDKSVYRDMWNTITNNEEWRGEIRNKAKNGEYFWVDISIFPVYDEDENTKIGYTSIRHNITDKKYAEELSITDGLTGLYNRRYFDTILPKVINSAKRDNSLVCLIMLDIDHFKPYNDKYGHQKGDDTLISLSKCIENSLRRSDDYPFRIGGEEFGIIIKVDAKAEAVAYANKIKLAIASLKIPHEASKVSNIITVSMGLVCKQAKEVESEETLYKEADDLLYISKNQGRDRVSVNEESV